MLRVARVMNISLICDNKNFMGSRPLKCETKMSELHSLLASVNSPFEFMCQTLGYPTLSQLDTELANRFEQKMPDFGCLSPNDMKVMSLMTENKSSELYIKSDFFQIFIQFSSHIIKDKKIENKSNFISMVFVFCWVNLIDVYCT